MAAARNVKSANKALAITRRPVGDAVFTAAKRVTGGDTLQNFMAGMGTDRDKRSYSHFGNPRTLTRMELENMYRTSWLAKRIVNSVADDMTREWRRCTLGDDDNNPQLQALEKAEKALNVRGKFNEALRWSRLYGGAIIILGIKGQNDLSKPLVPATVRQGDLQWMHVLDRWRVSPNGQLNTNLLDRNYGLPDSYIVAESSVTVHSSRIIRFNGQKLPYFSWLQNARWDDSELQHVIESLMNNDTMASAIATMMFEANVDVISSEGFADLIDTNEGEAKITKRYQLSQLMKSFNRTLLLDGTEKYEKKGNNFTNLSDVWGMAQKDVCGAAEIPHTRLFGDSSSGLNSSGDGELENYYGMVANRQQADVSPQLDYFDEIFVRHAIGDKPDDYTSEWKELWVMSDKDNAALQYNRAQRDAVYLTNGVVTPGLVASELLATNTYASMSDEDVKMAVELGEPMNPDQKVDQEVDRQSRINTEVPPPPADPNKAGPNQPPVKNR